MEYFRVVLFLFFNLFLIISAQEDSNRDCSSAALVENCQAKEGVSCEISGLLAYPVCADGFSGVGPVCWQSCPESFDNHGAYCGKPSSYGRGAGYGWFFNDPMANCEKDQGRGNCEWWGAVVYPKCSDGFYAFGCCVWYQFNSFYVLLKQF